MITRIEKDIYFVAGVHFDGVFQINTYDLVLSMLVETSSPKEHVVALERLEFFIKNVITNSVFICQHQHAEIDRYVDAGIEVCTLPEEPYDQVVAMALMLKLNSIMESRMSITDIVIGSLLSEGVRYPIVLETAENAEMFVKNGWWHANDTTTRHKNTLAFNTDNNVVKLFDDSEWANLNLSWKDKPKSSLT